MQSEHVIFGLASAGMAGSAAGGAGGALRIGGGRARDIWRACAVFKSPQVKEAD